MANSTFKKINPILSIALLCLLLVNGLQAQNITNSIYSRFGYGTETFKGFANNIALGGSGIALSSPFQLNYNNPASNAALKLTTFTVGLSGNYVKQYNTSDTIVNKNVSFAYIALGFPITKWWGLSFGLLPYTGVGYKIMDTTYFKKRPVENTYKGAGGLNKIYIANGINPFQIFKDSMMPGFKIGINSEFTFGNITNENYQRFIGSDTSYYFSILNSSRNAYYGFSFLVGAQYTINIKDDTKITFGAGYGWKSKLSNKYSLVAERYYNNPSSSSLIDSAFSVDKTKETAYLPGQYTFGFNLQMGEHFAYNMEYKVVKWASDSIIKTSNYLKDSRTISAGFQYFPNSSSPDGVLKHTYYRMGFKNSVLPVFLNDYQLEEQALTFGAGFPMRKSASTVNIGVELGKRGTTKYNMVKENYVMVNIGFTINDRWFIKSRYD